MQAPKHRFARRKGVITMVGKLGAEPARYRSARSPSGVIHRLGSVLCYNDLHTCKPETTQPWPILKCCGCATLGNL
jgi:hypothetical protein